MELQNYLGHDLVDLPPAYFPVDAIPALENPAPASNLTSLDDGLPLAAIGPAPSRAIRLVQAKSGQSELRLLSQEDADSTSYVLVSATLAPYETKRETLFLQDEKKTKMDLQQALDEFDRRVAEAYPSETLRNGKVVEIHTVHI